MSDEWECTICGQRRSTPPWALRCPYCNTIVAPSKTKGLNVGPNHWYWKKRKKPMAYDNPPGAYGTTGPVGRVGVTGPVGIYSTGATAMTSVTIGYGYTEHAAVSEPKDLGLAIEPIIGLRGYNLRSTKPVLSSFNGVEWPHREPLEAVCGGNPLATHDAPCAECACGIYSWTENMTRTGLGSLYGEVYLWGDVLICEQGYRAELAYPKTLHIVCPQTRSAVRMRDALADAYGVPVTLTDTPPAITQ